MTSGSKRPAHDAAPACLTGIRPALMLAVSAIEHERRSLNVHAVLNLLNRFVGAEDGEVREELVGRLAEYLAAAHQLEAGSYLTLGNLCELTRSYAAMRYLMADAIEPRVDYGDGDFRLRTEQSAAMMAFLQGAVDSLLASYTPWLSISIRRFAWWQVELKLSIQALPGHGEQAPSGWQRLSDGSGFSRCARFTAIARQLKRI